MKLRGGSPPVVKTFAHENVDLQKTLAILRSLRVFSEFPGHNKCKLMRKHQESLCSFCLIRSLTMRVNDSKGRKSLQPVEFLAYFPLSDLTTSVEENVEMVCRAIRSDVHVTFKFMSVNPDQVNRSLNHLLQTAQPSSEDFHVLFIDSNSSFTVNFDEAVAVSGKSLHCKAVVLSDGNVLFRTTGGISGLTSAAVTTTPNNVVFAVLEQSVELVSVNSALTYSGSVDLPILRAFYDKDRHLSTADRHLSTADRHLPTDERKKDRHHPTDERKKDRHHPTEERKKDRHLSTADRHHPTDERKKDRHHPTDERKKSRHTDRKNMQLLFSDTGMELICSVCVEMKSSSSCVPAFKLEPEALAKYLIDSDITRSKDGELYVCLSCKQSIEKNQEPNRAMYEFLAYLDFPTEFKKNLEKICLGAPNDSKPKTELNKLEDFLLKLCIPFIRIAHLPSGPYSQVKSGLVMFSSEVDQSIKKILPLTQKLLPISFKRSMKYDGHFIEEYVDRDKVLAYFQWFRKNNHLYDGYTLDDEELDRFENTLKDAQKEKASSEADDDDQEEDEEIQSETSFHDDFSVIMDKYRENPNMNTAANKMANMLIEFEKSSDDPVTADVRITDPEDAFFVEDEEIEHEEEEDEDEDILKDQRLSIDLNTTDFNDDDLEMYEKFVEEMIDCNTILQKCPCKCVTLMHMTALMKKIRSSEQMNPTHDDLKAFITDTVSQWKNVLTVLTKKHKTMKTCNHSELNLLFNNIVSNGAHPDVVQSYVENHKKKISKKVADKIAVAPAEKGKWMNWQEDLFLEEKLFPGLFPFGIGGYLSSNMIRERDMGFANYVRSRILSANDKFRKDQFYIFFLLLVKEMVEIKRSEQTYFRKATKVTGLTPKNIGDIAPDQITRYNNAFKAFRSQRGTAPYYEEQKLKLNAFIRQFGAPTLFCSFSCAEFNWDEMIHSIYETVTKSTVPLEFVKNKDGAWKTKFVAENVVQSTLHFSKRSTKLMALLSSTANTPFMHEGRKYVVDEYFFRVEYQVQIKFDFTEIFILCILGTWSSTYPLHVLAER